MSNDKNVWERLFKLWASVCKLLVDGKRDAVKVANLLQKIVDEKEVNIYLWKVADGVLGSTTGKRTLAKMNKLFTGFLDSDFINWGTDVVGLATTEAPFEVYEMAKNGTFSQVFGGFGVDLNTLCWSQDQIIKFVEEHPDLLHSQRSFTFFLLKVKFDEGTKNECEEFFVVSVFRLDDGQLKAYLSHFSGGGIWHAEHRSRFVIPQLPL